MSIGPSELVVLLLVVLLLFGSKRLGDLGKGIGEGIRGFKRGIADDVEDVSAKVDQSETPKEPPHRTGEAAASAALGDAAEGALSAMPSGQARSTDSELVASPEEAASDLTATEQKDPVSADPREPSSS